MAIELLMLLVYIVVGVSGFIIGVYLFRWINEIYKWLKLTKEMKERYSEMYGILEETIGEPEEDEPSEVCGLTQKNLRGGEDDE